VSVLLLIGLGVALVTVLWTHWAQNPDLSHGFFMPLIFLFLLVEARRGTQRYLPAGRPRTFALVLLALAGLFALAISGLYAASLGWSHDLVGFMLAISYALLLAAGLVMCASPEVRWIPFNWSALVAAGLWILCAPIPPGTYSRVTLSLQLMVSENVVRALHILGIGAVQQGNIIELANATVGIEEACSGVRSLVSCVFAGFFLSATLVRRPSSRAWLIALAAPLALLMNFLRSLTLTLLANSGRSIAGVWHDFTGFAVLGVTAAMLAALALILEKRRPAPAAPAPEPAPTGPQTYPPYIPRSSPRPGRILAGALTVAVALVAFFVIATRPAARRDVTAPPIITFLPDSVPGWRVETNRDLYQFESTLRTRHLAQRTYVRDTENGPDIVILYLAYWKPGQAPVSLVASHTPDACWPGSGWEQVPLPVQRVRLELATRVLADAEVRAFKSGPFPQNVWYWHLYDGHPLTHANPNSPLELLRLALRYGFRREGDQLFVRISSNRDWAAIEHTPFIESLFAKLQPLGL
jgi:exosortase